MNILFGPVAVSGNDLLSFLNIGSPKLTRRVNVGREAVLFSPFLNCVSRSLPKVCHGRWEGP